MTYFMFLLLVALVVGLIAVASNPTPYFAALGLVVAAGVGCGILVGCGGSFLSLVLFLIYLGGMLVVFAYSAALAAEPFPEAWGSRSVAGYVLVYLLGVVLAAGVFWGGWYEGSLVIIDGLKEFSMLRGDVGGVAVMYSFGGGMLVICAWVLLLTLLVVLELTRGLSRGTLRAV
uniref:NADH-ubiquinone oxidoreductase chain 6 n=4 Tax=Hemibarbus TaxID=80792 RepID=A0A067YCQ8_9TELE|nr:NADH dehydrogenase subunit 6 [Hemibarbus umbrifer]YP_009047740.1 NADH dehydrogenase subunit 6 [Hemibarbus medius]AHB23409.1 NADH dehydrogenase subunit 6 [Hemibarbus sp. 'Taiwanese barbel steed']AJD85359.1 NADH dehydrogenase subunit 6 [Hemibarbus labeo]AHA13284.1 NADH dehydrogenase subunit 6 [Hemibarbus medius]AIE16072.1 NADH dehydrogenase subunit 6 [Hemibarbus medius]QOH91238.1 NADH dehydrogenase subunit 6 [Hemibarbus labeo]